MKQEAKPTDIHLEPTEQSTLICVSLAAFPPRPPLPFPLTARARTRERADAQPIFTKNSRALYLINSAQIEKSHVDGRAGTRGYCSVAGDEKQHPLVGIVRPKFGNPASIPYRRSCSWSIRRAHVTDDARKVFRQPMRSPASK